jgi:hypothetical protein
MAKSIDDYPAQIDTDVSLGDIQITYSEGLNIDYRHFDEVGQVFAQFSCHDSNLS